MNGEKGGKIMQQTDTRKWNEKNLGITLIALVITIIILLILAGVSIVTLMGENGILRKSKLFDICNRICYCTRSERFIYNRI